MRFDSADNIKIMSAPQLAHVVRQRQWSPQFQSFRLDRKFKLPRHYTNHRIAPVVQCDLASNQAPIAAEAPLPKPVTDYSHLVLSLSLVVRGKTPSQEWPDSQNRKQIVRNVDTLNAQGLSRACEDQTVTCVTGDVLEGLVLLLKIQEIRRRYTHASAPFGLVDPHKAVRIRVGQRTQHYSIKHAEDCRVRTDAKGERNNHEHRKGRPA